MEGVVGSSPIRSTTLLFMEHVRTLEEVNLSEEEIVSYLEFLEKYMLQYGAYPLAGIMPRTTREQTRKDLSQKLYGTPGKPIKNRTDIENSNLSTEEKEEGLAYWRREHNKLRKNWFAPMIGFIDLCVNWRDPKNQRTLALWQKIKNYVTQHAYKGDPLKLFHVYIVERIGRTVEKDLTERLGEESKAQLEETLSRVGPKNPDDTKEEIKQLKQYIEEQYQKFSQLDSLDNVKRFDYLTEVVGALGLLKHMLGTDDEAFKEKLQTLIDIYIASPTEEQMHFVETMADWFLGEYKKTLHHTKHVHEPH